MSFLDTIVNVSITATSATPTKANFGTPAVIAYHTHNTDKIRTYFDLAGMVSDGFSTTEPAYLMAQSICEQNPRPPTFKVIRGTTAVAQSMTFVVTDSTKGDTVGLTLTDTTGTDRTLSTTVTSGESVTSIATAIAALASAVTGLTASATTSTVTIAVGSAGAIWYPSDIAGGNFSDNTASASISTDLAAAVLVDSDWYGISGAWIDATNITSIAGWTEANTRVHAYTSADSANLAASSGVFYTLKSASYARSYGQYSGSPISYGATGLMAQRLTANPGSDTWAYKTIAGTEVDSLTPTQTTNITNDNGNFYITIAGVNSTYDGRAASGLYVDITRGIDALAAEIQNRVFTLLVTLPKLPYTRAGIAMVGGEIGAAIQSFIPTGFISNDIGFQPVVSVPDLADVSTSDKQNRLLKNVTFTCYAQGAIQKVQIQGVVNI